MPTPLLYESHCHTQLCNHALGEPEEYAAVAEARGLKGIIFTCHTPLPMSPPPGGKLPRMAPEEYDDYIRLIARAREAFRGRVDVRLGLESDYYPGVEPWSEALHRRVPLHHILGSIHPQMTYYRKDFDPGDPFGYQQVYYDHLARAAETGLYHTLSHPDLIKNIAPEAWDFERIRPWVERALDRIAATGVAMELNASGLQKAVSEMNPGLPQLRMMRERAIPVVIGADAHVPERVGADYETALEGLREVGYSEVSFFLDGQRQDIPIRDALASLRPL